ncbi:amidohydrolase family protein [Rhodococcus sp. ACS1]|uniref:amidohydrolase family protein n=1 Tax=Rhodococcus sp. ACS1 TaxID=2028570 RepID=UPI0015CDCBC9|nr:amidohydrolase family protein [Rhodococcus sp. ACS1]
MSRRVLIRGGYIIPTAPADNDIPDGDILIEDGVIVAVGPSITEEADEVIDATGRVVIPGLIDTHRHLWETVLRNSLPDGDLMDYFQSTLTRGQFFRPDDVYNSNLLGAAGALNAGITTVLDWSHISNTPDHSDAAVAALKAAKIRSVYAHSVGVSPLQDWLGVDSENRHPDDIRRIVEQYRTTDDNLLTLAAGVRGPEFSSYDAAWDDIRLARELGLRITMHTGCSALGARNTVESLNEQGLLGSDITYIHTNTSSDGALKLIADTGGTISSSPAVESVMGHGAPPFARFDAVGLSPSLSVDAEVGVAGDLFGQMRSAYEQSRAASHTILRDGGQATLHTTRDVLGWATIEGARALGLDHVTGSLEVGKQADIVILDLGGLESGPVNSPIGALILNATAAHVTDVFVAGHGVKRDRTLMDIDTASVVQAAENTVHHLNSSASAAGLGA